MHNHGGNGAFSTISLVVLFGELLAGTGRSLHCQVENHVQTKFATPILYAIDNFKNYDFFSIYTQPLIVSFVYFFEIFSHLHFF